MSLSSTPPLAPRNAKIMSGPFSVAVAMTAEGPAPMVMAQADTA
ncbi:hypothetical protein PJL18_03402 [Paenarthrobacter nicotinovorans]|nr:hypothetical protein [Paenarthrobacter nicotinovorans]